MKSKLATTCAVVATTPAFSAPVSAHHAARQSVPRSAGSLLVLVLLAVAPPALPAESTLQQRFDAAMASFHAAIAANNPDDALGFALEADRLGEELYRERAPPVSRSVEPESVYVQQAMASSSIAFSAGGFLLAAESPDAALKYFDYAIDQYEQSEGPVAEEDWLAAVSGIVESCELIAQLHVDALGQTGNYNRTRNLAVKSYATAAHYLERILARRDNLKHRTIDEAAIRRRLFKDYFLIEDEANQAAQLQALARIFQQNPESPRTPLVTPVTMREEGEEITGAIEIEFDIEIDGSVDKPRITASTYTDYGGDEFEYLLLFWFKKFRFTPGVDGDNLVPVEAARYRLEGTRRLTRVKRRIQ